MNQGSAVMRGSEAFFMSFPPFTQVCSSDYLIVTLSLKYFMRDIITSYMNNTFTIIIRHSHYCALTLNNITLQPHHNTQV
jgi:hypothetical protein